MEMVMVGDRYLASGFRLIGIDTMEVANDDQAAKKVEELVSEGKCKIIFITEKVALRLKALREGLLKARRFYPVFVVIPDFEGPMNVRTKELHQLVNQAIGAKLK
jgi:vacuolar-type H+-ATPase subunit F/Vma7